ncbi:MAG: efflux RND transporter periplasmic adaptor subunit [Bacteroidetes bacterium]|nr:efflux RND transporter periplasmic adaptor subunit [Bacteroidota bacterium]
MRTNLLLFTILLAFVQCTDNSNKSNKSSSNFYYTCPMHPSVVSNSPGSCPVCNMSLVLVKKNKTSDNLSNVKYVTIDENSLEISGIKLDTVRYGSIYNNNFLNGIIKQDEENTITVSSRFDARIEKLYANTEGKFIEKGTPLFSLYSEKIIALQKELIELTINKSNFNNGLIDAAKKQLTDKGINITIINEIIQSKSIKKYITFYAEKSGFINNLKVSENMYIDEGQPLFSIGSANTLWVEAKLYQNLQDEFYSLKNFDIVSESFPGKVFKGKLVLATPVIAENERFSILKIKIDNPSLKLLQGSEVKVFAPKTGNKVILVPKTAIVYENPSKVWKYVHKNTFEQIEVSTGKSDMQNVEILTGLSEGDVIITDGSYLANSEFLLIK